VLFKNPGVIVRAVLSPYTTFNLWKLHTFRSARCHGRARPGHSRLVCRGRGVDARKKSEQVRAWCRGG